MIQTSRLAQLDQILELTERVSALVNRVPAPVVRDTPLGRLRSCLIVAEQGLKGAVDASRELETECSDAAPG